MCMIKARIRWCSCRVENILTLGKLLSLWFCFLLHSILFLISQTSYRTYKIISNYELARPIMETIFLVYIYGQTRLHYPARLRSRVIIAIPCRAILGNILFSISVSSLPSVGPIRSISNGIFSCITLPVMQKDIYIFHI